MPLRAHSFLKKRKLSHSPSTLALHHEEMDDLQSGWDNHIFLNLNGFVPKKFFWSLDDEANDWR